MNIKNEKEIKVVIAAGGDGTRMTHISKGRPKSLLMIGGRPLVAYQIDQLRAVGFQNIMLSFNRQQEIDEFKDLIKNKQVPQDINYSFSTHDPFDHPGKLFTSAETLDYIRNHDILYSHGDLIFESSMLVNMLSTFETNDECVVINSGFPKATDKIQYQIENNFITGYRPTIEGETSWRDGGIFIIPHKYQPLWLETFAGDPPSSPAFLNNLISRNIPIYVEPLCKTYININTETDYNRALEYFGVK